MAGEVSEAPRCALPMIGGRNDTGGLSSFIEPEHLRSVRHFVRDHVTLLKEATDRRGFRLLHWPSTRANDKGKPCELSLEHEARLTPKTAEARDRLLAALHASENRRAGEQLLPPGSSFARFVVRRYRRPSGPQSVDLYYDTADSPTDWTLIPRMITVRERTSTSQFMTWSATGDSAMKPLNLELPFVPVGDRGMTARLEFNWIDTLATSSAESQSIESLKAGNPLRLATEITGLRFDHLTPVLQHTTFREKFGFCGVGGEERFVLNVDLMVAQCLASHRLGVLWDVDISSVRPVDPQELSEFIDFAATLSARFDLHPLHATKACRDAMAAGLLAPP